jgi:glycosyltransferase involved in cell wall biosynthesis
MRIFVVEPDGAGGMVHYAYQLCSALAGGGADVTLVTGQYYELRNLPHNFTVDPRLHLWPAVGEAVPGSRLASLGVRLYRKARRAVRGLRYAWEWHRLTRHLIAQRPDVVQFAIIRFPFQVIFLRRLRRAGIQITQICHEFEQRERGGLVRSLNRRLSHAVYRSFDHIYLHDEGMRSRLVAEFGIAPERTSVIPHGNESMFLRLFSDHSDRRARYGIPINRPVGLFFGGLRPSKGIEDLLAAWVTVVAETDAHLIVCGEPVGVDPRTLEHDAAAAGIGHRVTIDAGYLPLDEVAGLFAIADVLALPYRSATASGVLQLAYAFGTPVVATTVGALTHDVEDGTTGYLVPPHDPDALARALIKILGDPAEATLMGDNARQASQRYDWPPIAATILADYTRITR